MTATAGDPRMLIDGEMVEAANGRRFEVIDPATGLEAGQAADGGVEDAARAVRAARRAHERTGWRRDPDFRAHCLRQLEIALREERNRLRHIEVTEVGAPISLTPALIDGPINEVAYWARFGREFEYLVDSGIKSIGPTHARHLVHYDSPGVVGVITPWNAPFYLNISDTMAPLMAGNAVVLKPSPLSPWAGTEIGRIVSEKTDIPAGIFNVVLSSADEVGAALVTDPDVDVITFTGSTETGRRILAASAPTIKKSILELGGKSAHVVLDDADLESCLLRTATSVAVMSGQACILRSRILLPRGKMAEGVDILKGALEAISVGDPWDSATLQGPLISDSQRRRVLGMIDAGVAAGATLVTGGGVPDGLDHGFFVQPTLLADVDPNSDVAQQEIFGPVLTLTAYDSEEQAVDIANGTMYGLSGEVSGLDEERCMHIALRMRTGTVSVNGAPFSHLDSPFGGVKQSGLGRRNGLHGFLEYLQPKTIAVPS